MRSDPGEGLCSIDGSYPLTLPSVPFGRHGTGWEVVYAALFLISNESSYVNAHTLFVDAGHMAGIVRS